MSPSGRLLLGLPAEAYHAPELGVASKSALDQVDRSPAHYLAWVEGKLSRESDALSFGTALHCAVLEPEAYASTYIEEPDFGDCRYAAAKAAKADWLQEHAAQISVSAEDSRTIRGIQASIAAHPAASRLLRGGQSEVTVRWTDEETGLACKSRADYWVGSRQMIVDLKSARWASKSAFERSVLAYRYHVQDALYRAGFAACGHPVRFFVLLAVEKTPPYAVGVYTLDQDAILCGHSAARRNMATLAECLKTNTWPAYSHGVETISLPPWAKE